MYSIGEVGKMLGISTHALRYYDKEGIVVPIRNQNNERMYNEDHLSWLKFVLRLKRTKMSITKIKRYAALVHEGDHTHAERLSILEEHQIFMSEKVKELQETEEILNKKIERYKSYLGDRISKNKS
ncbi:MerR family transcriptional regulator [Hazenella sp. IB182357]|uniref:MerR family transcriptional regulator n=1 Tax=Polycladospora coralii TaxID=2771432 RepID=A0A926RUA6_9BACL|nr:MerR family transcriptional regulator [Polycladospora coralii]MBD1372317.1 MerR family transcriptional regulator [Polycladospora coralii]MBS7531493.1 MerR family transcriptional regulator [Polycladospora coralii]